MPKLMVFILAITLTLGTTGCVSQSSLDGFKLPDEARNPDVTFEVLHQPKDERDLNRIIVSALQSRGFKIADYKDNNPTYVVNYIDRWFWDMRTYLIDFRVDVRNKATGVLVATARSYQTSLAAMGKSYEGIIKLTVETLVDGMEERLQEAAEKKARKKEERRSRH